MHKIVPLIASDVSGPLGVFHLMRLWLKARLFYAGLLSDGYDLFKSEEFDQKVLAAINISEDDFLTFMRTERPSYHKLELWIRKYPDVRLTAGKGTAETAFHE